MQNKNSGGGKNRDRTKVLHIKNPFTSSSQGKHQQHLQTHHLDIQHSHSNSSHHHVQVSGDKNRTHYIDIQHQQPGVLHSSSSSSSSSSKNGHHHQDDDVVVRSKKSSKAKKKKKKSSKKVALSLEIDWETVDMPRPQLGVHGPVHIKDHIKNPFLPHHEAHHKAAAKQRSASKKSSITKLAASKSEATRGSGDSSSRSPTTAAAAGSGSSSSSSTALKVASEPTEPAPMSHISWEEVLVPRPSARNLHGDQITAVDVSIVTLALGLLTAFFGGLISMSGAGAWRYYLAGGLCAAVSHTLPTPVDVVKTRKQLDPNLANKTFSQALGWIVKHEGPHALLAGLGPTVVGYLIEGSIKFGVYEATKPAIRNLLITAARWTASPALNSHLLSLLLSGVVSGFAASIVLCPMEALRIRLVAAAQQQQQKDGTSQKNSGGGGGGGFIRGGLQMIKHEGVSSMSRGMLAMLYKQVPYTVCKNVSFDLTTRAAYSALALRGFPAALHSTKMTITIASAALASVLSCISSQPGDMVLSLINANEGEQRKTHQVVRDIMRSERGLAGFFVGIKTRFLHVGIIVTLQLMVYDIIKQLCGIAATGSV